MQAQNIAAFLGLLCVGEGLAPPAAPLALPWVFGPGKPGPYGGLPGTVFPYKIRAAGTPYFFTIHSSLFIAPSPLAIFPLHSMKNEECRPKTLPHFLVCYA